MIPIQQLHAYHVAHQGYTVNEQEGKLVVKKEGFFKASPLAKVETARLLLEKTKEEVYKRGGFDDEEVRVLISCVHQYIKTLAKLPKVPSDKIKQMEQQAQALLLGQTEAKPIDKDLYQLLIANKIPYKVNHLGLRGNYQEKLCVAGEWIDFSLVRKQGNQYFLDEKFLFETNEKGVLVNAFFAGDLGIIPGSAAKSTLPLEKGVQQREADGNYYRLIITAVKSKYVPAFRGDHTFAGLQDDKGRVAFFGQYGVQDDLGFKDLLTAFSHKTAGIETPDRYSGLPFWNYHFLETKEKITKEEYFRIQNQVKQDMKTGVPGAFLTSNCTGYAQCNLQTEKDRSHISPTVWLTLNVLSFVLPEKTVATLSTLFGKAPPWVKNVLHFFPPVYLLSTAWGAALFFFSGEKDKALSEYRTKEHVINTLFRPWRLSITHPLMMRKWQESHRSKQHQGDNS